MLWLIVVPILCINFLHLTPGVLQMQYYCIALAQFLNAVQYALPKSCKWTVTYLYKFQSIMLTRHSMWVIPTYCCIIMILCRVESLSKTSLTSGPCQFMYVMHLKDSWRGNYFNFFHVISAHAHWVYHCIASFPGAWESEYTTAVIALNVDWMNSCKPNSREHLTSELKPHPQSMI